MSARQKQQQPKKRKQAVATEARPVGGRVALARAIAVRRRQRQQTSDWEKYPSSESLRNVARRAYISKFADKGPKNGNLWPTVRSDMQAALYEVVRSAMLFANHRRVKTLTADDVVTALKHVATTTGETRRVYGVPQLEPSGKAHGPKVTAPAKPRAQLKSPAKKKLVKTTA